LSIGFEAHTALVHADGSTLELPELIEEMAARTGSGYLFGGLSSSRGDSVQFAVAGDGNISGHGAASGVFSGGLSGVAFDAQTGVVSRMTQGCKPISKMRTVSDAARNVVYGIEGEPALDVMLAELAVTLEDPAKALEAVRATMVGLCTQQQDSVIRGSFGDEVLVRHIIGLDPERRAIALASPVEVGMQLAFCKRNVQAARADLKRICAEIREELESDDPGRAHKEIAGAVYVSCSGRGGPHFGGDSAEMQIVRSALGDVPLVGFFAAGEIAHSHLYGYTGVLTVFTGTSL
jgi:small ligand-binding sensory domain FIST